jgi:hypothetical protein
LYSSWSQALCRTAGVTLFLRLLLLLLLFLLLTLLLLLLLFLLPPLLLLLLQVGDREVYGALLPQGVKVAHSQSPPRDSRRMTQHDAHDTARTIADS